MSVLEELQGKTFPVGYAGYVRLTDVMGTDQSIEEAARVSYGEGTRPISDTRSLLFYLMRHRHSTPYEMAELKFQVRCPVYVARQWFRHRTGSFNEASQRYSEAQSRFEKTDPEGWRAQSTTNKQGSGEGAIVWPSGELEDSCKNAFGEQVTARQFLSTREGALLGLSIQVYRERIAAGVAREQARKDLPMSVYTDFYFKMDLHNLFHFLSLRMAPDAQQEIREYADVIGNEIVSRLFPLSWEAFKRYRLDAMTLSGPEVDALIQLLFDCLPDPVSATRLRDFFPGERNRERDEFKAKLDRLGFPLTTPNPEPIGG